MSNDIADLSDHRAVLPAHIEDTIRSIARLHAEHHAAASPLQRAVTRMVSWVGHPMFLSVLTALLVSWIGGNLALLATGHRPLDPPPFAWFDLIITVVALYMTVLILITQRHDDQLSEHREQLTLELTILAEQKSAKIIELLEEIRRDSPTLSNRTDHAASAMSEPADPNSVLNAIKESQAAIPDHRG